MGKSIAHHPEVCAGEPGVWVRGQVNRGGVTARVCHFFLLDEYRELGKRASERVAIRESIEAARLEMALDGPECGCLQTRRSEVLLASCIVTMIVLGCACFLWLRADRNEARHREAATAVDWTEEGWREWCRKKWSGSEADQAVCLLRAQSEQTDIAVCKAAILLGEQWATKSSAIHLIAARGMIEHAPRDVVVSAIWRDAHLFGLDPEMVTQRLWKALEQ